MTKQRKALREMVDALDEKNYVDAETGFKSAMDSKINSRLKQREKSVAKMMFGQK